MTEEWRPCPDYQGRCEVSNLGRIRSLPRVEQSAAGARPVAGGIITPQLDKDGYPHVSLRINGVKRYPSVHRLVCRAFNGEQPNPLHKEVAHLDGVRTNCRPENLKWVSRVENHSHKLAHGTDSRGEKSAVAKLRNTEAAEIKGRLLRGERQARLAREFGVSIGCINNIRRGRTWRHMAPAFPWRGESR